VSDHLDRLKLLVNNPDITQGGLLRLSMEQVQALHWAVEVIESITAATQGGTASRPTDDGGNVELRKEFRELPGRMDHTSARVDHLRERVGKAEIQIDGLIAKLDRVTKALGETP
jgi:hypothetical protein